MDCAGAQEEVGDQLLQSQPSGQQATLLLAQVQTLSFGQQLGECLLACGFGGASGIETY